MHLRILVDGQDLRGVTQRSIRRQVSVVWQDPFLINETVRANLLMARDDASDEQLEEACRRSHCWEFIRALPRGLEALRANRTTLIIAHRHSSIRSAHRVMYFEGDGSLSVGTHEQLMAAHPAYREAVEWQTGGADRGEEPA